MLLECRFYLGPSVPGLYFRNEFIASLVQTGQYVLGSEGPCVRCLEIVGLKYSTSHFHQLKSSSYSPLAEATARHAVLTR